MTQIAGDLDARPAPGAHFPDLELPAFRAGLGARFAFLSDADRLWLDRLGLRESTDTVHDPYQPAAFTLFPDLRVHSTYNGYWYSDARR